MDRQAKKELVRNLMAIAKKESEIDYNEFIDLAQELEANLKEESNAKLYRRVSAVLYKKLNDGGSDCFK